MKSWCWCLMIALSGCARTAPTGAEAMLSRVESSDFERIIPAFERPVTLAVWRGLPEDTDPAFYAPVDPEPVDPTTTLAWPAPPSSVGCIVRGKEDPFPASCGPELLTVHDRGVDIALVDPTSIELVWGIPRKASHAVGLWVHGRSHGISVTGHARKPVKFALKREVMVVKDHVWAMKEAPVIPRYADDGVSISIQGDFAGVEDVRGSVGCDDLAFDALEGPVPIATPVAAPAGQPEPAFTYARGSTLTLLTEPGGTTVTTLHGVEGNKIYLELEVKETRGSFTRVAFETEHARFDVWVANREIGGDGGGMFAGRSFGGCGRSGHGGSLRTTTVGRRSAIHLGKDAASPKPVSGLQIAAGIEFTPGETKNGFIPITLHGSPITPVGEQLFWIPESALEPLEAPTE